MQKLISLYFIHNIFIAVVFPHENQELLKKPLLNIISKFITRKVALYDYEENLEVIMLIMNDPFVLNSLKEIDFHSFNLDGYLAILPLWANCKRLESINLNTVSNIFDDAGKQKIKEIVDQIKLKFRNITQLKVKM